jgi:hypothetical protein
MSGESGDKKGKGFGGLFDLTSRKPAAEETRASDSATAKPEAKSPKLPPAWRGENNTREPMVQSQSRTKSGSGGTWTILTILGVIVAGGVFLDFSSNQQRSHPPTDATVGVDAAAVAQATTDTVRPQTTEEAATDASQAASQAAAAAAADAAIAAADAAAPQQPNFFEDLFGSPQNATGSGEVKPPIGTNNILSGAQIRYCLFERYRVDGAETQVNQYGEESVDLFNSMVDDFNSRCSSYRYRVTEYGPIASEANQRQATLKLEGMRRLLGGFSQQIVVVKQPEDQTAAAIQEAMSAGVTPASPETVAPAVPAQPSQQADELPEFAVRTPYGVGWTCIKGYSQAANSCIPVEIPLNGMLDYTGHGWTCQGGFYQAGRECLPVELPENATMDYTGHNWTCGRGFYQAGRQCLPVEIPDNGTLDYTGHDWTCSRGFYQAGNQCVAVDIPQNGTLDYTGHDWTCSRGFYRAGKECSEVAVPVNGSLDFTGHDWACNPGYVRSGNQCQSR